MGGNCLAVSDCTQFGILFTSGFFRIVHQLRIELAAAFHNGSIVVVRFFKSLPDILLPVVFPVGHPVVVEILDSIQVVVSDHQEAADG